MLENIIKIDIIRNTNEPVVLTLSFSNPEDYGKVLSTDRLLLLGLNHFTSWKVNQKFFICNLGLLKPRYYNIFKNQLINY